MKRKEQALAERVLRPEREIDVVKVAMVNLQKTLTENTRALDARHVDLKVAANLEKLTILVEICKWRYPDKRWIGT